MRQLYNEYGLDTNTQAFTGMYIHFLISLTIHRSAILIWYYIYGNILHAVISNYFTLHCNVLHYTIRLCITFLHCIFFTSSTTGHAMALMTDDDYLDQPASVAAEAIQLYVYSLERFVPSYLNLSRCIIILDDLCMHVSFSFYLLSY